MWYTVEYDRNIIWARRGGARQGEARHGKARQGKARQGSLVDRNRFIPIYKNLTLPTKYDTILVSKAKGEFKLKRVVIISDLHCGHLVGLTHPNYDFVPTDKQSDEYALYKIRQLYYTEYKRIIESLKPIDVLIANGDLIDGRGEASGGTELLFSDRNKQVAMASAAINDCEAGKIFISYGTPYHTGKDEDWEDQIADKVNAVDISDHGFIDVNGLIVDYKHRVGSSSVPYARATPIAKERVWNMLNSEFNEYPKSDVIIRSHVHYFGFVGGSNWLGVVMPALQGHGTKYGNRQCSGTVDWGLISIDVEDKADWTWNHHIVKPKPTFVKATKV